MFSHYETLYVRVTLYFYSTFDKDGLGSIFPILNNLIYEAHQIAYSISISLEQLFLGLLSCDNACVLLCQNNVTDVTKSLKCLSWTGTGSSKQAAKTQAAEKMFMLVRGAGVGSNVSTRWTFFALKCNFRKCKGPFKKYVLKFWTLLDPSLSLCVILC